MRAEQLMGYTTIFFGILGSWGLWLQIRTIWSNKSAQSVSGVWTITSLAMFASFLIYGTQEDNFPMEFMGWLRVAFLIPMVLGFFVYGERRKTHWVLLVVYPLFLSGMSFRVLSPTLYLLFSSLGIWASFVQAYTIKQNRSHGQVKVELQFIYLASILCLFAYGYIRKDIPLTAVSAGFAISYVSTIIMWFKYP